MTVFDEEIDLRPYIRSLIQHWWRIILFAFLAAVAALAISLLQKRMYEATATLLLTRTRATLSLADKFPTVNEPVDSTARLNAVLSIAQSDALAQTVLKSVNSRIKEKSRELQAFKEAVKITNKGDAILITARADDPELAAEIANAWANEAALSINQAYSGEQPLSEIQTRRESAQKQYQAAQADLESFIQNNQIELLSKRIEESNTLFDEISNNRAWEITYYDNRIQNMLTLITQAEALKNQLERGNRSGAGDIGDALAVLGARTGSLGISQEITHTVGTIDLQLSDFSALRDTTSNYVADLNTIIEQGKEEKAKAEVALQSLMDSVIQKQGFEKVEEIAANIRELNTQLEKEKARELELTNNRDLALKAYQTLWQKETEIKSAPQVSNAVTVASQAIPPEMSIPRGTVRNVFIAGALGVVLGVFAIIFLLWWKHSGISQTQASSPESDSNDR